MPDSDERSPDVHPALAAYRRSNAKAMRIYAVVLVVLVVVGFVLVKLAYAHGSLDKVSAATGTAPAQIASANTAARLTSAWHTDDQAAGGTPFADGIVVTFSAHTVSGRDAVTGAVRWHYTRSDETICSVLQQDSSTIAIYDREGNCDEVTGFVTATGVAKWYRTLMDDGSTAAASAPNIVLTVADHSVHVFDNAGGLDRWNWPTPDNCTVTRALAGTLGVLIAMDCGSTHQLVLRGLTDDSTKWTITTAYRAVPVAASAFVGAMDPTSGALHLYSVDKGADSTTGQLGSVAAEAAAGLPRAATTVDSLDAAGNSIEFGWFGSLFGLAQGGKIRWSAAAAGPGSLAGQSSVATAELTGDVVLRRMADGTPQTTVTLTPKAAPAGARVYPVGAGLLVANPGAGATLYR